MKLIVLIAVSHCAFALAQVEEAEALHLLQKRAAIVTARTTQKRSDQFEAATPSCPVGDAPDQIVGFAGYSVSTSDDTVIFNVSEVPGTGSVAIVFTTYNLRDSPIGDLTLELVGDTARVIKVVATKMNRDWTLVSAPCAEFVQEGYQGYDDSAANAKALSVFGRVADIVCEGRPLDTASPGTLQYCGLALCASMAHCSEATTSCYQGQEKCATCDPGYEMNPATNGYGSCTQCSAAPNCLVAGTECHGIGMVLKCETCNPGYEIPSCSRDGQCVQTPEPCGVVPSGADPNNPDVILAFSGYSVSTSTNTITYSVPQGEGSVALVFGTYNIRDSPIDDANLVLVGAAHRVVNVVTGAMNKRWCLVTTCASTQFSQKPGHWFGYQRTGAESLSTEAFGRNPDSICENRPIDSADCFSVAITTPTTTTTSTTTVTTTTTTTTQRQRICKRKCRRRSKRWGTKCKYYQCGACPQCAGRLYQMQDAELDEVDEGEIDDDAFEGED